METPVQQVVNYLFEKQGLEFEEVQEQSKLDRTFYARHLRPAKDLIELAGSVELAKEGIDKIADRGLEFNLNTVIKKWLEICQK